MGHLDRLESDICIPLHPDAEGYIGRECPRQECLGYFKVTPGTGLERDQMSCHCPYCGHVAGNDQFCTQDQIAYVKSVVFREITGALLDDLREAASHYPARGPFGIGVSVKVEGEPEPIWHYGETPLETPVVCEVCTLRYTIYGVFGYCPDCGVHNSLQILRKNLELAGKQIVLAATQAGELADHLLGDALENAVSAFDGFGRETCRVNAATVATAKPKKLSFQNLSGARTNVQEQYGFDLASALSPDEWRFAVRCFQKRHLLAHAMGVVNEDYLSTSGDTGATLGRKVRITPGEVTDLFAVLHKLGAGLVGGVRPAGPLAIEGTMASVEGSRDDAGGDGHVGSASGPVHR